MYCGSRALSESCDKQDVAVLGVSLSPGTERVESVVNRANRWSRRNGACVTSGIDAGAKVCVVGPAVLSSCSQSGDPPMVPTMKPSPAPSTVVVEEAVADNGERQALSLRRGAAGQKSPRCMGRSSSCVQAASGGATASMGAGGKGGEVFLSRGNSVGDMLHTTCGNYRTSEEVPKVASKVIDPLEAVAATEAFHAGRRSASCGPRQTVPSGRAPSMGRRKADVPKEVYGPQDVIRHKVETESGYEWMEFPPEGIIGMNGLQDLTERGQVRDYEHKIKAYRMREAGVDKKDIAEKLDRTVSWVSRWWRVIPETLPKPDGAGYKVMRSANASFFRDVEIRRGLIKEDNLFEELANGLDWKKGKVLYRHEDTNELTIRFDANGKARDARRWCANYTGGLPSMDRLLQKAFSVMDIRDTKARVVSNYYEDGNSGLFAHRHDYWTCLISLGSERVLNLDDKYLMVRDGDVLTFGTQMHGVPMMPLITTGRMSVIIFFFPGNDNLEIIQKWLAVGKDDHFPDGRADLRKEGDDNVEDCGCCAEPLSNGEDIVSIVNENAREMDKKPAWRTTHELELHFNEGFECQVTICSVGVGYLSDKEFWDQMINFNITALVDLRTAKMQSSGPECLMKEQLKRSCRRRFVKFRGDPLGHKGGIANDVASDHGRFIIWKMCAAAKAGEAVAFVGLKTQWDSCDTRQVVGHTMMKMGAKVIHCMPDDAIEHPKNHVLPPRLLPTIRTKVDPHASTGNGVGKIGGIGAGYDCRVGMKTCKNIAFNGKGSRGPGGFHFLGGKGWDGMPLSSPVCVGGASS